VSAYAEYDSLPGIRWSVLSSMRTSPLHYRYRRSAPQADTPAMLLGRLVHCAVLEPDLLPREFVVWEAARRGKEWAEFVSVNAAKDIVTAAEYTRALAIRDAVHAHPDAAALLAIGESERTVTWTDPDTGLACKSRVDHLREHKGVVTLADLKTTKDISPRLFGRTCDFFRYPSQLGFYAMGVSEALDVSPDDVRGVLIAVESDEPHDVAVYRLSEDDLWAGTDEARELLRRVRECEDSGHWPGAHQEAEVLELPAWTWGDDEESAVSIIEGRA